MEDMDTYSMISQRIVTDDIFSIVDSYSCHMELNVINIVSWVRFWIL